MKAHRTFLAIKARCEWGHVRITWSARRPRRWSGCVAYRSPPRNRAKPRRGRKNSACRARHAWTEEGKGIAGRYAGVRHLRRACRPNETEGEWANSAAQQRTAQRKSQIGNVPKTIVGPRERAGLLAPPPLLPAIGPSAALGTTLPDPLDLDTRRAAAPPALPVSDVAWVVRRWPSCAFRCLNPSSRLVRHLRPPNRVRTTRRLKARRRSSGHLHRSRGKCVSMPCWPPSGKQGEACRDQPFGAAPCVAVEAQVRMGWDRRIGRRQVCRRGHVRHFRNDRRGIRVLRDHDLCSGGGRTRSRPRLSIPP